MYLCIVCDTFIGLYIKITQYVIYDMCCKLEIFCDKIQTSSSLKKRDMFLMSGTNNCNRQMITASFI